VTLSENAETKSGEKLLVKCCEKLNANATETSEKLR
jgi:hypothetical protein